MIGVVVPAHNEEACLPACLDALLRAARHPALKGEDVRIVVVLDDCHDGSAEIVMARPVTGLRIAARNVGVARAHGAAHLLAAGARWLAFTDADSVADERWLADQLSLACDAVCGCVTVDDWSAHPAAVRLRYLAHYQHRDDHRHVHGANLGVSARAYTAAGGFSGLALGEDVALVEALLAQGVEVKWSALPRVVTSARKVGRAAGGFADFVAGLADGDGRADAVA
ncbi:glycosyl transferase [Bordetella genomosp. 10]|uniref:Glycosyl transferase n=1 Tax=Bordetella genomosp. 10 TaxID=1416804 RepID=A0A261SJR8_9BORD|nr:glycosyltransferase [Bordetella genomosp. 10]OZI37654.1 glycosyl transferase [Bordetella genomosp. 10]